MARTRLGGYLVEHSSFGQPTPFETESHFLFLNGYFDLVPRYLLRTYAPNLPGHTTSDFVKSAAIKKRHLQHDIFSRPEEEARNMLEDHVRWKNKDTDNLTSWISSLIFALQHAVHRYSNDYPRPRKHEIAILLVDTKILPPRTFLPAIALLEAYEIKSPNDG
ncbi:hypothetical protein BU23DRAFT_631946 [Bimuria novae-zelandiae CBS 107.79]|uniref:DUF7587 domain-containing protein n=1 Tax=Bimuria novae-zelandiae CBS 107.79 TaxID=1447943 RepID=A0A6A5UHZ2_9PLEO|nr:hypothetical protein BU23DRAFT_631946 [Bimuria novae-zelandiae CBS 107.79]